MTEYETQRADEFGRWQVQFTDERPVIDFYAGYAKVQRNALEAAARLDGLATNAAIACAWCIREMAKELDPAPAGTNTKGGGNA